MLPIESLPDHVWESIRLYTMLDRVRAENLWRACRMTIGLPGHAAELGVYKGGSALLIVTASCRTVHLFDTFSGMPSIWRPDQNEGYFSEPTFCDCSEKEVRPLFDGMSAEFHVGKFSDTSKEAAGVPFALVHLDCDLYTSVTEGFEFFWPRLAPGGLIVLDDYGRIQTPGVMEAYRNFFRTVPHYAFLDPARHYTATIQRPFDLKQWP